MLQSLHTRRWRSMCISVGWATMQFTCVSVGWFHPPCKLEIIYYTYMVFQLTVLGYNLRWYYAHSVTMSYLSSLTPKVWVSHFRAKSHALTPSGLYSHALVFKKKCPELSHVQHYSTRDYYTNGLFFSSASSNESDPCYKLSSLLYYSIDTPINHTHFD